MKSPICEMFDIEFPLIAFSHCRDVVVAVSKAGGMGVLGAVGHSPEKLEIDLKWIDDNINGMPYGVDVLVPNSYKGKGEGNSLQDLREMIPQEYRDFRADVLQEYDVSADHLRNSEDSAKTEKNSNAVLGKGFEIAQEVLDVAFAHPIKLVANALGVPPDWMLKMGKDNDVAVAALVGAKEHAIKQVEAGVDLVVVSGTEGGGHCGSVSTMVLVPEVRRALKKYGDIPILAAGGIATGEQMAGIMAMGADGVWCASVFLPTNEAETSENIKQKMVAASSSETVRSKSRTGKHSRQLKSPWTDAWESKNAPEPLPMPLQTIVSEPALRVVRDQAEIGHEGAKKLETYWVGQGIGLVNESISAGQTVQKYKEEFIEAYENMNALFKE
ncbi:nitronate monooxygenase [Gammaproteobacteria bacterium]|nr:nitronate monooxygenase [Gammaproteobacteria bacterium]MDA7696131.1 nitronate monooxygenase [Gammaproteobacteria bacterium]MDA7821818.1 nitronate monooxygenase [Gammaproteobacteria bacterium]MDA8683227.1 nitronate monooxygenase [Gammaproteobacteria bacterium]MDA8862135.1 nitronate monooxygenase [Gammaproteobacteria bacterium]|tara:strand:- start:1059 stop:2213 length:1155 start_codon:yes stop_codon:yes gene_type:complete